MANLEEQAQEREIDGVTYKSWPVSFKVGKPALLRLMGILAPMLSSMMSSKGKQDMAAALFSSLPVSLSNDDIDYFAKLLGDAAQYKNANGDWVPLIEKSQAAHFEGRYFAFFQWLAFGCEVSFASFFTGIKNAAKADASLTPAT